jgi:hypothetical protein
LATHSLLGVSLVRHIPHSIAFSRAATTPDAPNPSGGSGAMLYRTMSSEMPRSQRSKSRGGNKPRPGSMPGLCRSGDPHGHQRTDGQEPARSLSCWADIHRHSRDPARIEIVSPAGPDRLLLPFSRLSTHSRSRGGVRKQGPTHMPSLPECSCYS